MVHPSNSIRKLGAVCHVIGYRRMYDASISSKKYLITGVFVLLFPWNVWNKKKEYLQIFYENLKQFLFFVLLYVGKIFENS